MTDLRELTPAGENVTSVSWAGPSRLVVLGSEVGRRAADRVHQHGRLRGHGACRASARRPRWPPRRTRLRPLLASYGGRSTCCRPTPTGGGSHRRAAARSIRADPRSAEPAAPAETAGDPPSSRPRGRPLPKAAAARRTCRDHRTTAALTGGSHLSTAHERVTGGGLAAAVTVDSCGAGWGRSPHWCSRWTARVAGARGRSCASGAEGCWAGRPRRGAYVRHPSRRACHRSTRRAGTATRCGRWSWRTRSAVRWAWPVRWARRWRERSPGRPPGGRPRRRRSRDAAAGARAVGAAGGGAAGP